MPKTILEAVTGSFTALALNRRRWRQDAIARSGERRDGPGAKGASRPAAAER